MTDKFLTITIGDSAVQVSRDLKTRSGLLGDALVAKMTFLMQELQKKAQANVPQSERVRASIRDPHADLNAGVVTGYLDWGGVDVSYLDGKVYDLALIIEKGAKAFPINPLTDPLSGKGTRLHEKGAKTRFGTGAKVLRWGPAGKPTFRPYAFRKATLPKPFMATALQEMEAQFTIGLKDTIQEFISKPISTRFRF